MVAKKKEKYIYCPVCFDVTTVEANLESIERSGSVGMCYCQFTTQYINEQGEIDCDCPREFIPYQHIKSMEKFAQILRSAGKEIEELKSKNLVLKSVIEKVKLAYGKRKIEEKVPEIKTV